MRLLAGESSPLYLRLYGEGLIKADFSADFESTAGIAYCAFMGSSRDPDRVFEELREEARRIIDEGVPEKLFERVKKACFGRELRALGSFENVCHEVAAGHFRGFDAFEMTQELISVSLSEVNDFIRESMKPENMAISLVLPSAEAEL